MKIGQVVQWDAQSDVFRGEYRLVQHLGGRRWIVEDLEPSDVLIAEAVAYYFSPGAYLGYHDPYGPERRRQTPQEALDKEILSRIERAGRQREIEFVSAARWAEAF